MNPIVKLDIFKNLLGEGENAEQRREESDEGESEEGARMTEVKLERDDLKTLMREAMAAGREDAMAAMSSKTPSAKGGVDDETGDINALSVKLSNFWTEDPDSWFDRADNQFLVRGIKEDATKFAYVVQALDYAQHKEVRAIIRNPPKGASYAALRKALVSAFGRTELDKNTELLNLKHLGDRDPRSVARDIDALCEDPASLPRAVMINLLPQDVRTALATVEGLDTHHKVAEQAYIVMNMRKDRGSINAVKQQRQWAPSEDEDTQEVDAIQQRRKPQRGRGNGKPSSMPGPQSNSKRREELFVCFAHKKFGSGAFTCKPGCTFEGFPLAQRGAGNGSAGR